MVAVQNFVFGYGSLICPESRKLTNPTLARKQALPVLVHNVERQFTARTASGYTAMDLRLNEDAKTTGVLLGPLTDQQLSDLDEREVGYDRLPVPLEDIEMVDFLDEEKFYNHEHPVFLAKENKLDGNAVNVWMYMHSNPTFADQSHPIAQSYVDIIIRGCLRISRDFAESFIETTDGWQSGEQHWVEDRDDPLYVRADPVYSSEHGHKIDKILDAVDDIDLDAQRVEYDPEEHLGALEKALEEDMAHPKALEKVEAKIVYTDYVFGYGSLICKESRKITNPRLGRKEALPVIVHNVERQWSARSKRGGYTAMDLQKNENAQTNGVLLAVTTQQLADLDVREGNYDRVAVPLDDIEQVDFLDEDKFYDKDHPVFWAKENRDDSIHVWMYMHKDPTHADASHPIAQSYVDIILRGCLKISREFAEAFVETTDGWDNAHWVEDRDDPLYVRADPVYSSEYGHKIDKVLDAAEEINLEEHRVDYNPEEHLEALEEALEEDLAHPKALEKIEAKVEAQNCNENGGDD